MATAENDQHVDVNVTELCGVPVLRKYVKRYKERDFHDKNSEVRPRKLLCAVPLFMLFSTIISAGVLVGILYYPPPLVEELTESILLNFGKGKTLLEEQLRVANETIVILQRKIEGLEVKASANLAREKELLANFSMVRNKNTDLLTRMSSANQSIRSMEEAVAQEQEKSKEVEENYKICMQEKSNFQQSVSNSEERENKARKELGESKKIVEQLSDNIKKLTKDLLEADQLSDTLENHLKECKTQKRDITREKESIEKQLQTTLAQQLTINNTLTYCKAKKEEYMIHNESLKTNLSNCQNDLKNSNENLSATQFTLGKCKSKNMDHEVRTLELIEENEKLKKELNACT